MRQAEQLFEIIGDGNVLILSFKAPYINDTQYLEELEDGLRAALMDHPQRLVLIDFGDVELIVSRMINSLLLMVKRVRAEGGQVHLCSLDPKVERVFKTMKLDRVFDMHESRSEGLAAMKAHETRCKMAQFA